MHAEAELDRWLGGVIGEAVGAGHVERMHHARLGLVQRAGEDRASFEGRVAQAGGVGAVSGIQASAVGVAPGGLQVERAAVVWVPVPTR